MLAARYHAPELELSAEEAEKIAIAIERVARHYPLLMEPLTRDWIGLATTCGAIYGGKAMALAFRRSHQKEMAPNFPLATNGSFSAPA